MEAHDGKQERQMGKAKNLTEEELIRILKDLREKLGRDPAKKDVPEEIRGQYKSRFGKWCYALEAAGIRRPSEATLERRRKHRQKTREKYREIDRRRKQKASAAAEDDNR